MSTMKSKMLGRCSWASWVRKGELLKTFLVSVFIQTQKEAATMEAKLVLQIPMLFLYFLAVIRGVTTKQLYPEYDLELSD